jgi:hypothetical protein
VVEERWMCVVYGWGVVGDEVTKGGRLGMSGGGADE